MAIKVVAFDVNNTLAYWPPGRVQPLEVQRFLVDFGIDISYLAYEAARYGVLVLDAPKRPIEGWIDFLALLFARMSVPVSTDLLASLAAMFSSRDGMLPLSDAMPALDTARSAGLVTCAFTTLPPFMLGAEAGRLTRRLDHYFNCSTVGVAKGDRRFYQRIAETLGAGPGEILAVGDDPIGDCCIPAAAGWRVVLLDRERRWSGIQLGQTATIASLSELPPHWR